MANFTSNNNNATMDIYKIIPRGTFLVLLIVGATLGQRCDPNNAQSTQCSHTQYCDGKSNTCVCLPGYSSFNGTYCVDTSPHRLRPAPSPSGLVSGPTSGSIAAGILVPLCLIVLVICAIYANRKYSLLTWLRRRLSRRGHSYDEFMIGHEADDDDPPLR